jgi:PhnB protein
MSHYKPAGYSTVSPYLIVSDAAATIRFLERVLNGKLLRVFADEQGRVMHAEVQIEDTVVMLADSAPDWPPVAAYAHVYVADVDSTYERALAEGAASVQAPEQKGDEDKRGGVKDSGGTTWWIATRIG